AARRQPDERSRRHHSPARPHRQADEERDAVEQEVEIMSCRASGLQTPRLTSDLIRGVCKPDALQNMAGHNKWSKVKRLKAVTDSRKGKVFSRLSRDITLAAKAGGGDPEANARLRTL